MIFAFESDFLLHSYGRQKAAGLRVFRQISLCTVKKKLNVIKLASPEVKKLFKSKYLHSNMKYKLPAGGGLIIVVSNAL